MNSMSETPQKDAIIKIIRAFYPNATIYLFGSYAKNKNKWGSDIDIAIDVGFRLNIHEQQFLWNLLNALPTAQKIDLVDMRAIPENMHDDIIKTGIAW